MGWVTRASRSSGQETRGCTAVVAKCTHPLCYTTIIFRSPIFFKIQLFRSSKSLEQSLKKEWPSVGSWAPCGFSSRMCGLCLDGLAMAVSLALRVKSRMWPMNNTLAALDMWNSCTAGLDRTFDAVRCLPSASKGEVLPLGTLIPPGSTPLTWPSPIL